VAFFNFKRNAFDIWHSAIDVRIEDKIGLFRAFGDEMMSLFAAG